MKTSILIRKSLISATVLMSLSAVPALAYADTDSYVELQFDSAAIGDLMRRELATQSDFCPQVPPEGSKGMLVDHLELGQAGALSRGSAGLAVAVNSFFTADSNALFYTQPVDVVLKSFKCAREPGCTETTVVHASLTYELHATPSGSVCLQSHSAEQLPEGFSAPELDVCLPFNASTAMQAAGLPGGAVSGSAISLSPDGDRFAVRIELGRTQADYDYARVDAWQHFVAGAIEPSAAAGDWSVFTHKSLILGAIEQRLAGALASHGDFTINQAIQTSWADLGEDGAAISATASGALSTVLCPNEIHVNDILLSAVLEANPGEYGPNGLRIRGEVGYDVSGEDATVCGLALGGSLGGLILGSVAESISLPLDLGPDCTSNEELRFACGQVTHPQYTSVGPLQIARSELERVAGTKSGLVMSGPLSTSGSASLTMAAEISAFDLDHQTDAYTSDLRVTGTGKVCGVDFWASDAGDANLFVISAPSLPRLPYAVELPGTSQEAYAFSPFHMMATVRTSAGVATYELPYVDVE